MPAPERRLWPVDDPQYAYSSGVFNANIGKSDPAWVVQKEDVTLEAFLPALEDYLRHLQSAGYVLRWRVEQRQVLGHFDRGLPDFTHYIAIEFPDLDHDAACYKYVSGRTEPVHALHVAMYQQVQAGARFFLTYEPASQ